MSFLLLLQKPTLVTLNHATAFLITKSYNSSIPEHLTGFYSSQPEAVGVAVVVTCPSAVALYEGSTAELLQAGARGGQSLTGAFWTCTGVLRDERERLVMLCTTVKYHIVNILKHQKCISVESQKDKVTLETNMVHNLTECVNVLPSWRSIRSTECPKSQGK